MFFSKRAKGFLDQIAAVLLLLTSWGAVGFVVAPAQPQPTSVVPERSALSGEAAAGDR